MSQHIQRRCACGCGDKAAGVVRDISRKVPEEAQVCRAVLMQARLDRGRFEVVHVFSKPRVCPDSIPQNNQHKRRAPDERSRR